MAIALNAEQFFITISLLLLPVPEWFPVRASLLRSPEAG